MLCLTRNLFTNLNKIVSEPTYLRRMLPRAQVGSLMMTSCGGLVGLCIVAGLVIITGILTATITVRDGRVAPLEGDEVSLHWSQSWDIHAWSAAHNSPAGDDRAIERSYQGEMYKQVMRTIFLLQKNKKYCIAVFLHGLVDFTYTTVFFTCYCQEFNAWIWTN